MPMAPAPITIIDFGCSGRIIASLLPITVFPLKGRPGIDREVQPVEIRMFGAVRVSVLPSARVSFTSPGLSSVAVPRR